MARPRTKWELDCDACKEKQTFRQVKGAEHGVAACENCGTKTMAAVPLKKDDDAPTKQSRRAGGGRRPKVAAPAGGAGDLQERMRQLVQEHFEQQLTGPLAQFSVQVSVK